MNRIHIEKSDLLSFLLIGIFVLLILIPVCPANMPIASRDSGVFLYSGWRVLGGDVPYKEFWDHKPPVIFFINALGLLISQNSRWGVWFLELIFLFIAAILSYLLFKKVFGRLAAIISVFLWMFTLGFVLEGGNYTTEYALPLQFACFSLAYESEKKGTYGWRGWFIGILSGILFFTKQNTVGIFVSIILYVAVSRAFNGKWKEMFRAVFTILGGFLLVVTSMLLLFFLWDALEDFWSAAFLFNFAYSAVPKLGDRAQALYRGWLLLSKTNLVWFGFMGWSIVLAAFLFARKSIKPVIKPFLAIGLINLPIELGLVALGGRLINHHFMTLLPIFGLFTAFFLSVFFEGVSTWFGDLPERKVNMLIISVLVISLPIIYIKQVKDYVDLFFSYRIDEYKSEQVIAYIINNSSPDESLLALEAEAYINFASQKISPDKYVYHYPLYMQGYTSEEMVKGFLEDVIDRHPQYIIDKIGNWIRPENYPVRSDAISVLIGIIDSDYTLETEIGPWKIYRFSGK